MELKKIFENGSDCHADTFRFNNLSQEYEKGKVIPAMTWTAFNKAVNLILRSEHKTIKK